MARKVSVAIVGAGFGGIATAVRLKQKGQDDFVVLERGDRDRRRLAGEHLPGHRLRRPVAPLLALVRAQPRLEPALLPGRRDSGVPGGCCRPLRRQAAHPVQRRRRASDLRRSGRALAPRGGERRGRRGRGRDHRLRPALPPVDTACPRARPLQGADVPLGPLGPRLRSCRQAGRGHRNRRKRDPIRTADRRATSRR